MVRSQQLEIWFGQLGLVDGSEEVGEGTRVFRSGFGKFFKSGLKQGKKKRDGEYDGEENTIAKDVCLGTRVLVEK